MNISIELNSFELTTELITKIKDLFKNKTIKIVITESDTTDYLFNNLLNREHLIKSISETETIDFTEETFLEYSQSLIK